MVLHLTLCAHHGLHTSYCWGFVRVRSRKELVIVTAVQLTFNSRITPLDKDGSFNEEAHRALIMPVRARIMELDGTAGCYIAPYGVRIEYIEEITTPEAIRQHVQSVLEWAGEREDLFPMLQEGQKAGLAPKTESVPVYFSPGERKELLGVLTRVLSVPELDLRRGELLHGIYHKLTNTNHPDFAERVRLANQAREAEVAAGADVS
jgi:hypothetical protein